MRPSLTDFIMFPETENIISHFVFKELTNNLIYKENDIDLIFIELPKFKGNIDTLKSLTDKWIYFLKEAEKLETISENMATIEAIKQAFQIANRTNLTREELEDLQKRELFIHDQQAMKIQAEKEGMEKGREETRKEIALNLLKNNMNIQEIAQITG